MAEKRRKNGLFYALAAAILALVPLSYFVFLREPPPKPPPPAPEVVKVPEPPPPVVEKAPEPPKVEELQLAEAKGTVEIRRGQGKFEKAEVGVTLHTDDALRTSDGSARLTAGSAFDVSVEPGTTVEVKELTSSLSRLSLADGMLVANVQEAAHRTLEVGAQGSDAVARTSNGGFAMSNNGAGTVAVGARSGEVELSAAGQAVLLRAGQESIVHPKGAPSAPTPIPGSLFLKVAWPESSEVNKRKLELTGKTVPGAHVVLAGRTLKVEKDGRFSTVVQLREGHNALTLESVDVGGNRSDSHTDVTVDTTAPDMQFNLPDFRK